MAVKDIVPATRWRTTCTQRGLQETYSAHELLLLEVLRSGGSGRLTAEYILGKRAEFTANTLRLTAEALSRRGDISVYRRGDTYDMQLHDALVRGAAT